MPSLSTKRLGCWLRSIPDTDQTRTYRALLVIGATAYLVFGLVYRISFEKPDPLLMTERLVMVALCVVLLVLSYVSRKVHRLLPALLIGLTALATFRTLHAAHLHQYRLDVAMSIVVVVVLVNLIFDPGPPVLAFNVMVIAGSGISAILADEFLLSRWAYLLSLAFVSAASYHIACQRYRTARQLADSRETYRQLFTNMTAGFAHCRPVAAGSGEVVDYRIIECNAAFAALLGASPAEISGENWFDLYPDSHGVAACMRSALRGEQTDRLDWFLDPPGRWLGVTAYSPREGEVAVLLTDVTERREREDEAVNRSFRDPITDLYNRRFFDEELQRLDTARQLPISIVLLDINGLKAINDAHGHRWGDEVIRSIGRVLDDATREEDIVARIGGDEFALLLPLTDAEEASSICVRIREGVRSLDREGVLPFSVGAAVGCATKYREGEEIADLFDIADRAMYRDKEST